MAWLWEVHRSSTLGPSGLGNGSASFADPRDKNAHMTLVVAGGIFNVSEATCGVSCITCCGYSNLTIFPNPANVTVGQTVICNASATRCDGQVFTVGAEDWSSSDSSIMTVTGQTGGTALATGVSPGAVTIFASIFIDTVQGQMCSPSPSCLGVLQAQGSGDVAPVLTSISPAQGLIGNTVGVTLQGNGFSGATVNAGAGITVNILSTSSTQIGANFVVSSSASAGNHTVAVTVSGQTSNSLNFFVQVPTSLSLSLGTKVTYNGSDVIECAGGNDGAGWGYSRCATFTLEDQTGTAAITTGSFTATESVPTVSSNPPGLKAKIGGGTLVNGTFLDFWAFVAVSSPPPQPGEFVKARQSISIKDNNAGLTYPNIRINCRDFESNDVM